MTICKTTLSILTICIITLSITALSIVTNSITAPSIVTNSIMALSILTICITTLSITTLNNTTLVYWLNLDTQHNNYHLFNASSHYVMLCHKTECTYSKRHNVIVMLNVIRPSVVMLSVLAPMRQKDGLLKKMARNAV
jgi:hypothetical protein